MLVVNLFGAPGAGKSTGAAYVFSKLKLAGYNAELVTEFAKDKVWEDNKEVFNNQMYIFGKQYFRISRLNNKVDIVVTDSPLLLSAYYSSDPILGLEFDSLVTRIFKSFDSINCFIERAKPYNPRGRFQSEKQSDKISKCLNNFLNTHGVICRYYKGNLQGYDTLIYDIISKLRKDKNC